MVLHKKVNKSGGITIPSKLRHEAGIRAGTALDIATTDEGLLITKHTATCHICGSVDDVIAYKGFDICRVCSNSMVKEFNENDSGNQTKG